MHAITIDTVTFADWLEANPSRQWSVDGEETLAERVSFPCSGVELGAALRKTGREKLVVFSPIDGVVDIGAMASNSEEEALSFDVAAWADDIDERWFVFRDVPFEKAYPAIAATKSA